MNPALVHLNIPRIKKIAKRPINRRETKDGKRHWNASVAKARKKLAILERDQFKCTECGSEEKLTVHHIGPVEKTKSNHRKNSAWNDMDKCCTLCVSCHIRHNKTECRGPVI